MAVAGTLEIDVILNGKKARIGLNELRKRMGLLEKSAKSANKVFGRLAKFASIGFIAKMALDSAKLNRELGLMAERTGVSFEIMSKMRNAFKAAGGDAKLMDRVVSHLSSGLARLSMGDGTLASQLMSMGISAWGKGGKLKTADVLMGEIADYVATQRASGVSDQELFTLLQSSVLPEMNDVLYEQLKGGSKSYYKAVQDAASMTKEESESLGQLNKAFAELKTNIGVVVDKIISNLSPALTGVVNIINDVAKFSAENKEVTTIIAGLGALAVAIKGLAVAKGVASILSGTALAGTATAGTVAAGGAAVAGGGLAAGLLGFLPWLIGSGVVSYAGGNIAAAIKKMIDDSNLSNEDKIKQANSELAKYALKNGNFASFKDQLAWMAERSDYYKQLYEQKYGPLGDNYTWDTINGKTQRKFFEDMFGNEIMTAATEDSIINVTVSNKNNFTQNGDGTVTADTTTTVTGAGNETIVKEYSIINGS